MIDKDTLIERTMKNDAAMGDYSIEFHRAGIANVELASSTMFPEDAIYFLTRAYKGIYRLNYTQEDIDKYPQNQAFEDIKNTKLQTPLEMINTTWLLTDVSRAFTHQLVRYRVGTAYIQESMRFLGMKTVFKILMTHIKKNSPSADAYMTACTTALDAYVDMLGHDIADQDARGVLPTNILTNIYFHCSLRTLQGIFPQRLCCQAQQGEWQPILRSMRELIAEKMGTKLASLLEAPYERGEDCGYRASFDRPCVWTKDD